MISRVIVRGIAAATKLAARSAPFLATPQYSFGRKIEKAPSTFGTVLEQEIKAEEGNLTDLTTHAANFEKKGWTIKRDNVLVELSKTTGKYEVRLLSNIKSPTNFGNDENKPEGSKEGEENDMNEGEFNEVTVLVNKKGQNKTMVVSAIVTQGYQVTSINFYPNYEEAKSSRLSFNSNVYVGPEMESLSDELFEGIYNFLEHDCDITEELLESFGDYCIDAEQSFYINWLKDIKSML